MQLQARVRIWGRPRGRSGHSEHIVSALYIARENARVGAGSEIPEINYTPQPIVPERTTYIGVIVKDQDGEFVPHTRVRIKLPDGDEFVRKTDKDGEVMIKGFVIDGMAEIELLDFVEALPETAAADEEETTAEEVAVAEELLTEEKEFVVKVVDETGKGVPGVSLVFSGAGKSKSVPTDGGGVAKWKAAAESVEVTFESAEAVNKAMKAVWKGRAATAEGDYVQPGSDTAIVVSRAKALETPEGEMFSSTSVDATQPMTLSVRPAKKRALLIEMHDTLFRNNSAVVNPEGEAPSGTVGEHESITTVGLIATVLRYNEEHEGKKLFVAGHTDRAGDEKDNVKLSEGRANAVLALIEGNKAEFVKACKAHYSEVDVTQLMDWTNTQYNFTCKPTTLKENPSDPNFYRFRTSYNEWVKGPLEDGEFGPRGTPIKGEGRMQPPDIWDAMFDLYEHNLRQELGEDEGGVAQLRSKLVWVDDGNKTIGFGEKHPTAENTVDGTRSQADRRVEVMLFDEEDAPDLSRKKGEDVYDGVTFERKTIEPLKSAKPWRAYWEVKIDPTTGKEIPACADTPRKMIVEAHGLPAGEPMVYTVEQRIDGAFNAKMHPVTSTSQTERGEADFGDWFDPEHVQYKGEVTPGARLPAASYRFEVICAGRRKVSLALPYGDYVDVTYQHEGTKVPLSNSPFILRTPWASRPGIADDNGRIRVDDLPPGGALITFREYYLVGKPIPPESGPSGSAANADQVQKVTLRLLDRTYQPRKGVSYRLLADFPLGWEGCTDDDGLVTVEVPPGVDKLTLVCSDYESAFDIDLETIPSVDHISGLRARLNNLGYDAGAPSDTADDALRHAVSSFRLDRGIVPPASDTIMDQPTRDALVAAYGH